MVAVFLLSIMVMHLFFQNKSCTHFHSITKKCFTYTKLHIIFYLWKSCVLIIIVLWDFMLILSMSRRRRSRRCSLTQVSPNSSNFNHFVYMAINNSHISNVIPSSPTIDKCNVWHHILVHPFTSFFNKLVQLSLLVSSCLSDDTYFYVSCPLAKT